MMTRENRLTLIDLTGDNFLYRDLAVWIVSMHDSGQQVVEWIEVFHYISYAKKPGGQLLIFT